MDAPNPLVETDGNVLIVTLNRPARRNAIDHATAQALQAVWDRYDDDPALRAAVLTGAGGYFSAGADLHAAAAGLPPARTARRGPFGTIAQPPCKPLLAAVEGDALGGGFELALACDILIAADNARFGLPECRRGVLAAGGGLVRLPGRVPANIAMEMAFSGQPQPAARLHALGLINHLTPPGGALGMALRLARDIAQNAPLAVMAAKRVITAAAAATEAAAWALQAPIAAQLRGTADYREGIAAFDAKRAPTWTGT